MSVSELYTAVNSINPVQPVIRVLEGIETFEGYLEPGMVARVVGAKLDGDDVIIFDLVLTEFEEHNKQFEKANYFDKNGEACLNAREANCYSEEMKIFTDKGLDSGFFAEYLNQKDENSLKDPVKTFELTLQKAKSKNPSSFGQFSINNIKDLALFLFLKSENASPLAIATRSCIKSGFSDDQQAWILTEELRN